MESDGVIPELKKLVDRIHGAGATAFGQFLTPVTSFDSRGYGGGSILYSSPTRKMSYFRAKHDIPHEIDTDDIERIVRSYGVTARRMKEAGYLGFEIKGMPEHSLYRALKGKAKEIYEVGQSVSPRKLLDSVYDAAVVGRLL